MGGVEIRNCIRQRVRGGTTTEVLGDEETGVWEMSEGPVHLHKGVRNGVRGRGSGWGATGIESAAKLSQR